MPSVDHLWMLYAHRCANGLVLALDLTCLCVYKLYTVNHALPVVVTTLLGKLLLAIACTVLAQARSHDVTASNRMLLCMCSVHM